MSRYIKKKSKKTGTSPGTFLHIGKKRKEKVTINLIDYNIKEIKKIKISSPDQLYAYQNSVNKTWININGVHETKLIEKIGNIFSIHPLTMEDIVNTGQRSKFEEYEHYIFIVLKILEYNIEKQQIDSQQVSLLIGETYLFSFQENLNEIFTPIIERFNKENSRIRKQGTDYLAYTLIDFIIDQYFGIVEKIGEQMDSIEQTLIQHPVENTLHEIYELKREIIYFRKILFPIREVVRFLAKSESSLIKKSNFIFIRNIYDHTFQLIDTIESYRDMLSNMLGLYQSSISNKTNEVMKILAIISTIFIPITFVVGIYGMNFKKMPELEWEWGYLMVWVIICIIIFIMCIFFKIKKWF